MSYDRFSVHLDMLRDRVRTESYRRAIAEVVRPGDHVLDFGCGTGVLSIFAERAGAERVYALDRSRMLTAAKRVFARNGCTRIQAIAGDADAIELPGQVDVIVSEWMGHFLFAEPMHEPLLRLRDRYLRPGGRMLPARSSLHAGLVVSPSPFERLSFLRDRPYGIDFGSIADGPLSEVEVMVFTAGQLLPQTAHIGDFDLEAASAAPSSLAGTLRSEVDGLAYGLAGWFAVQLAPGIELTTSPLATPTHWGHYHFPFSSPLEFRAGDAVEIQIEILRHPQSQGYTWRARTPRSERAGDNVLMQAWLSMKPERV